MTRERAFHTCGAELRFAADAIGRTVEVCDTCHTRELAVAASAARRLDELHRQHIAAGLCAYRDGALLCIREIAANQDYRCNAYCKRHCRELHRAGQHTCQRSRKRDRERARARLRHSQPTEAPCQACEGKQRLTVTAGPRRGEVVPRPFCEHRRVPERRNVL